MFPRWEHKGFLIAIGVVTFLTSLILIIVLHHLREDEYFDLKVHICFMQMIGSISLIFGCYKQFKWFLLPWILVSVVSTYTFYFMTIDNWRSVWDRPDKSLLFNSLLYALAGSWSYFTYGVTNEFSRICATEHFFETYPSTKNFCKT